MRCPNLEELPPPPAGRTGWPWTEACAPLPDRRPDGSEWPRISLVTPCFNQGRYIEETLRSVLLQGYPNLEYIVIDGGSSDETLDTLRKYEQHLTYWISEPDRGQSHAINKGLSRCSGDIFNWLNSDDLLLPGALESVAEGWIRRPGNVVAGPVVNFGEDGTRELVAPKALTAENFVRWQEARRNGLVWHQPGTFLPLDAVKEAGGVREDMHYEMDYLLMIAILQTCEVTYVDTPFAAFRLHESSKTVSVGINRFRVIRMKALRAMDPPPCNVSRRELREDHARALVWCAKNEMEQRKLSAALRSLCRAAYIAPRAAISECRHKRLLPMLRRLFGELLAKAACVP